MAQKKAVIGLTSFLLVVLLLVGGFAMAAEIGSKEDPLVTVSYIMEELNPRLMEEVNKAVSETARSLETKMQGDYEAYAKDLSEKIVAFESTYTGSTTDDAFVAKVAEAVLAQMGGAQGETSTGGAASIGAGFVRVVVPKDKTITFKEGAQIVHRLGSGKVVAPKAPGLVDLTAAGALSNGQAVVASHLYLCTVSDNGIKASEQMTIFVQGTYVVN